MTVLVDGYEKAYKAGDIQLEEFDCYVKGARTVCSGLSVLGWKLEPPGARHGCSAVRNGEKTC